MPVRATSIPRSLSLTALALCGVACGSDRSDEDDGGPTSVTQTVECASYLKCVAVAAPIALPDALPAYGESGSCWRSVEDAETCTEACVRGTEQLHEQHPGVAECGGGGAGGAGGGSSVPVGDYFLALSLKLSKMKPIVFRATFAATTATAFSTTFQPLMLDRKTPTGIAQSFGPFEIAPDGSFSAVAPLQVPGDANPITPGSGIALDATLAGEPLASVKVGDPEGYCGEVTGSGTTDTGLYVSLEGSTFAMQAIADPASYPSAVYDCEGTVAPLPD